MRFAFIGMMLLLSGCDEDRDRQFAQCELKYGHLGIDQQPYKVGLCMKAAGYKPVWSFCTAMELTTKECWE